MENPPQSSPTPPPRAFTQGLGVVFQVSGCVLFLAAMFVCCGSSLLSKEWAEHTDLTKIGWTNYSAQRALTICVAAGVFFGVALAAVGLGMQAEHRRAAMMGVILTLAGVTFWLVHTIFAAAAARSEFATILAGGLAVAFIALLVLAVAAAREMERNPPKMGHEVLPAGYKIPYSHYHDDPPEVRLAAELQQRRERLAVQQKELELLEEKLKKKLDEGNQP
jgi:hypothetical protein